MTKDNMKASDVFNQTEFMFQKKGSFEEVFPSIKNIKIKVIEHGSGVMEEFDTRTYDHHTAGQFIDCSNRACFNGGFNLGRIIREIVQNKKTHLSVEKTCQGYEGSPKGKKRYGRCDHYFEITIDLEYKENFVE